MGGGSWTATNYCSYNRSVGRSVSATTGEIVGDYTAQSMFKQRHIHESLDPYKKTRECCDSDEHPETVPVILALDVTGSMGSAAVEVARKLNVVMTELYGKVKDVEFMIMGIGDFKYDEAPLQVSQFESDIRIAEQLDSIWFEGCGGGNNYESYTAAWYFAARNTKLDCWNRGKKGIIITMGDEMINPYIPYVELNKHVGSSEQSNVETAKLYNEVSDKYDVFHLVVDHGGSSHYRVDENVRTFGNIIGQQNVFVVDLDNITKKITNIIIDHANNDGFVVHAETADEVKSESGFAMDTISW